MTDHVIIQVRDDIITRLKAGVTSVSSRVYRKDEIQPEEIDATNSPALVVWLGDDVDERMGMNASSSGIPSILEEINQTLFVGCLAKADGDVEKTTYNLRADVETTLLGTDAGLTLGGKVVMLTRVAGANNRDDAPDQGAYNALLQFEVKIRHLEGLPTSFVY